MGRLWTGLLVCVVAGCESDTAGGITIDSPATVEESADAAAPPGNWPNWMGPGLNGISTESDWSVDWPDEGLPVAWTHELGTGFSSVSVVDDRLYSMGHNDGKETVWCLNAETGDVVWSHDYDAELNANLYEGGPGSTPTIHGDRVYTLSVDGRLLCLDRHSGDVIWEQNLQQELDVGMHEWGFNASPVILGNQLLLEAGRVASFDATTGAKQWQTTRHAAGYGSVRPFSFGDQTLLASLDCDGLRFTRAADGGELAFHSWESPYRTNATTPVVQDDAIFISTGYNVGCGLFRLTGEGGDDDLKEVYTSREMRNHFNNCVLYEGHLYGFDGNSNLGRVVTLKCLDFATGEVRWAEQGLGCGSLMIAGGRLVILSDRGDLVVANARATGYQELARSSFLTGKCWTVPVLVNGRVYGRNARGRLVCAELPTP